MWDDGQLVPHVDLEALLPSDAKRRLLSPVKPFSPQAFPLSTSGSLSKEVFAAWQPYRLRTVGAQCSVTTVGNSSAGWAGCTGDRLSTSVPLNQRR